MHKLGDSHNFGKFVYLQDGKVYKPRNCYFEWLFLCLDSPLRRYLDNEYFAGKPNPLPELTYYTSSDKEAVVSYLTLIPPGPGTLNATSGVSIGKVIALTAFFGMTDLHHQNIAFGHEQSSGKLVFAPLDMECIFDSYSLLTQTRLLPTYDLSLEDSGLSLLHTLYREFPNHKFLANLIEGYIDGLQFLEGRKAEIYNVITQHRSLMGLPIRMVIRPTRDYYKILNSGDNSKHLDLEFDEEQQLKRGDIPYFFRIMGKGDNLFYYQDEIGTPKLASIEQSLQAEVFGSYTDIPKILVNENGEEILQNGAMQLLRFFNDYSEVQEICSDKVRVNFHKHEILLEYDNTYYLACDRETRLNYETKSK